MNPQLYEGKVTNLRYLVEVALDKLIPAKGSRSVAVLDYPHYPNVGDHAIWLGIKAYVRDRGLRCVYTSDIDSFSPTAMIERMESDTVILLSGGGNFGDLWEANQLFREMVIRQFQSHQIVMLPQSVHFNEHKNVERAKLAFESHPRLTLMLRDSESYRFCVREFPGIKLLKVPDMAFVLGYSERTNQPKVEVLGLIRKDKESTNEHLGMHISECVDWPEDKSPIVKAIDWLHDAERRGWNVRWLISKLYDLESNNQVLNGIRILSRGNKVVTDRLHGHILCVLSGIPHVALDNSYGKIGKFIATWKTT